MTKMVTVTVDFTFDLDEYQHPTDKSDSVLATELIEAVLHDEADMPEDHTITNVMFHPTSLTSSTK